MSGRNRRAIWVDARFLIGIALVAISILGVWLVVNAARMTISVAVSAGPLIPGQAVSDKDLRWAEVSLGDSASLYVTDLPDDAVMVHALAEGELLPKSSVIASDRSDVTTVVISSTTEIASSLGVGSAVEVWFSPKKDRVYGEASVLIAEATVAGVREGSKMGASGGVLLELVILRDEVPAVLDAQASQAALWAVPLGGVR